MAPALPQPISAENDFTSVDIQADSLLLLLILFQPHCFCRAQGLCESRGGRPEIPVPNSPYGLCGRKATLNYLRAREACKSGGDRPGP